MLIMLLCVVPFSFGAYYDFDIQVNTNPSTTDSEIGSIVVSKSNIVTQFHNITIPSTRTIERYDTIRNQGADELSISNTQGLITTVLPAQTHQFVQTGQFILTDVLNNNATITVTDLPEFRGSLQIQSEDLNFGYDTNNFVIPSSKFYDIILLDFDRLRGEYDFTVRFVSPKLTKTVEKTITIGEIRKWNMTQNTVKNLTEMKAGDIQNIGFIELKNIGNSNFDLGVTVLGDIKDFINVPTNITLFRNSEAYINVISQIPSLQEDKKVSGSILLQNEYGSEQIDITLDIKDLIPPEIRNISYEHPYRKKENVISVLVFDNVGVERATVNVTHTNTSKLLNMTKDQQLFTVPFTFLNTTAYRIEVCAYDFAQNKVCKSDNKTFVPMDIVIRDNRVQGNTVRVDTWNKIEIINITDEPFDGVQLEFISLTDNAQSNISNFNVRLLYANEQAETITPTNNMIQLREGVHSIEVRGTKKADWEISFRVHTKDFVEAVSPFIVSGRIGEYNSPNMYESNFGSQMIKCLPVDTGIKETSYYECQTQLPIDVDLSDVLIPISVQEKRLLDAQIQELKNDKTSLSARYFGVFMIMLMFMTILVFVFLFYNLIYPKMIYIKPKKE